MSKLPSRRRPQIAAVIALVIAGVTVVGCSSDHESNASVSAATSAGAAEPGSNGTAHASVGDLDLTGGYIPQPASPDVAAAYLRVANKGSVDDSITKVVTSVTADVMAMTEVNSGGVGTMTDLSAVTIPAHGSVNLTPGFAHLMLENPTRTLKQGDTVSVTITFAHAGTVTMTFPVVPLTGPVISAGNMSGMPGMG